MGVGVGGGEGEQGQLLNYSNGDDGWPVKTFSSDIYGAHLETVLGFERQHKLLFPLQIQRQRRQSQKSFAQKSLTS